MEKYVIRIDDGTFFCRNKNTAYWGDLTEALILNEAGADNEIKCMAKSVLPLHPQKLPVNIMPQLITDMPVDEIDENITSEIADDKIEVTDEDTLNSILSNISIDPKIVSLLNLIESATEELSIIHNEAVNGLSKTDREISDIYHYLEFHTFNAYKGYLIAEMLQEKVKARRRYKNTLCVYKYLVPLRTQLSKSNLNALKLNCKKLCDRKYTEREIDINSVLK